MKAISILGEAFPRLVIEESESMTRFIDPAVRLPAIDLMRPVLPVNRLAFRETLKVAVTHEIPSLEMILVCKFAAMTAKNRKLARRYLDAADFLNVLQNNSGAVNLAKLRGLATEVSPSMARKMMESTKQFLSGGGFRLP